MKRLTATITAVAIALAVIALPIVTASASGVPCGNGGSRAQNKAMVVCLSKQAGLQVSAAEAVKVGNCESGFYAKAHNPAGPYDGIFQLLPAEFKVFPHQGPAWMKAEFKQYHYSVFSARGNALAALAHAHTYGWGAWSCA